MTFGSLFSGIGGLDLGLERAGLECRWQVEKDPWCRMVLARHWPSVPRHDDVATFPLPGMEGLDVDIVCGGDPCQHNSRAGTVWRRGGEDLGIHFLRVVDAVRPRFVLRENPSAVRADAPWPWWRFRSGLESLGYAVLPFRLRACCLGLDHRRDRLFLLAELPDPSRKRPQGIDRAWLSARVARRAAGGRARDSRRDMPAGPRIRRVADGVPQRVVRRRLTALGNAVPPPMGEWIGRLILEATS